jgi:hypothetical protein
VRFGRSVIENVVSSGSMMSGLERRLVIGWLEAIAAMVKMHGTYWGTGKQSSNGERQAAEEVSGEGVAGQSGDVDEQEHAPGYGTLPTLRVLLKLAWGGIRTNDARIQSAALRVVREAYWCGT